MKSTEYVALYKDMLSGKTKAYEDQPDNTALDEVDAALGVCNHLFMETKTLMEIRKSESNDTLRGVLRELDQKWASICRRINHPSIQEWLFRWYVIDKVPQTTLLMGWTKHNANTPRKA